MSISISQDMPKEMYWVESYFTTDVGEFEIFPKYVQGPSYSKSINSVGIEESTDKGFLVRYTGANTVIEPFTLNPVDGSVIFDTTINEPYTGTQESWQMTIAKWKEGYVFTGAIFASGGATRLHYYNFT